MSDAVDEKTLAVKTLVRDGRWAVPVSERPIGWESRGIPEGEPSESVRETAVAVQEAPVQSSSQIVAVAEVANGPEAIPAIQGQLAEWARIKLEEAKREEYDLRTAHTEAKARKWKCSTLLAAANKALLRVSYYEKVVAALDAGYMLFPPIDDISVLAIRTTETKHGHRVLHGGNSSPDASWDSKSESGLPPGKGEYKNPRVRWWQSGAYKDASGREMPIWKALNPAMEAPEFPLLMAKVSCVEATSAAMEQKVFDEIAIYPAQARKPGPPLIKDPVVLGRIYDPIKKRWLSFLISWRVNRNDL